MTKLLVAVDGSEANRAALAWAITEAERTGGSLTIATVADLYEISGPYPPEPARRLPEATYAQPLVDRAAELATRRLSAEQVTTEVHHGYPSRVLLDLVADHTGVVVGKRGLGAIRRVLVGSTSIAVAGRAPVPVVVVPDAWDQDVAGTRPVVVGQDMEKRHDAALRYAFAQASGRGAGLQVLQGWQPHPLLAGESMEPTSYYAEWTEHCRQELEGHVKRLGEEFPDVAVEVTQERAHPVELLTDHRRAQLLVLGRDPKDRWSGFTLGSVARGVLHHSEVPVAVVPAD